MKNVDHEVMCQLSLPGFNDTGFEPSDIDLSLCTLFVYENTVIDFQTLTIEIRDPQIHHRFYQRIIGFKKSHGVKVSFLLGGTGESAGNFSPLLRDDGARAQFVNNVIQFIESYNFNGLVFAWYPVCWLGDCSAGYWDEKLRFVDLTRELSREFKRRDRSLSIAIPNERMMIDMGYDIPNLSKYVDWMIVNTIMYKSHDRTAHIAPLFARSGRQMEPNHINFTVNYLIEKGAPPRKIIKIVPTFGSSVMLLNRYDVGLNAPIDPYSFRSQSFFSVCRTLSGSHNWTIVSDPNGAYAYQGDLWIAYQDIEHVRRKANYIRDMHLGGALLLSLDAEDFRGECCKKYPLLRAMNEVLRSAGQSKIENCIKNVNFMTGIELSAHSTSLRPPNERTDSVNNLHNTGNQNDFKVICGFFCGPHSHDEKFQMEPEHIDPHLCTHISFEYASLDPVTFAIEFQNPEYAIGEEVYKLVTDFRKSHGLHVFIVLGGWSESSSDKYSRLVRNSTARTHFVKDAVEFIKKYNFNGLEIDWMCPVCRLGNCEEGDRGEKKYFVDLIEELSREFKPRGWTLSTTVSKFSYVIHNGYDIPELAKYVDWMTVKTDRYWSSTHTMHHGQLFAQPQNPMDQNNANFTVNYLIEKGAPRHKIIMLIRAAAETYTLSNPNYQFGLNAPASGDRAAGQISVEEGWLYFYEVCLELNGYYNRNWTIVHNPYGAMGPYAYLGNQWLSFDDIEDVRRKANYVREMSLGGMAMSSLYTDDFHGVCCKKFPVLRTINEVLRNYSNNQSKMEKCIQENESDSNFKSIARSIGHTESTENAESLEQDFKVICYFDRFTWRRPLEASFTPAHIDTNLCTHIIFLKAVLNINRLLIDDDGEGFEHVTKLRKSHGAKILLALGDYGSRYKIYSRLVRDGSLRRVFVEDTIRFIERHKFDGLEFSWDYPVCWGRDCSIGYSDEKDFFVALMRELSEEFKPRGWLLSTIVSAEKIIIDEGYNIPELSKYVDWMRIEMNIPLRYTSHFAPLFAQPDNPMDQRNLNFAVNYLIEKGAPPHKIVLPFYSYGRSYTLANTTNVGLNAKSSKRGVAREYTNRDGFLSFPEICLELNGFYSRNWTIVRDSVGAYAYRGDQWFSYTDIEDVRRQANYIRQKNLGGGAFDSLDQEDFNGLCCGKYPLLKTMNEVLRNNGRQERNSCVGTGEKEKKSFRVDRNRFIAYADWSEARVANLNRVSYRCSNTG